MQPEIDKPDDSPKASSFTNKGFAGLGFAWLSLGTANIRLVTEICVDHRYWSAYNWMPFLAALFFGLGWGIVTLMKGLLAFAKRHGLKRSHLIIIFLVFIGLFFAVGWEMRNSDIEVLKVAGSRLFASFVGAGFFLKLSTAYALLQSESREIWKS